MERYALVGILSWVGGVGAWAVGAGYAIASARATPSRGSAAAAGQARTMKSEDRQRTIRWGPDMVLSDDGTSPPSVEAVVDSISGVESLPAPPQSIDGVQTQQGSTSDAAALGQLKSADSNIRELEEAEAAEAAEEVVRSQLNAAAVADPTETGLRRPADSDYDADRGALLTESQRRRLAPIKSLKRVRRSRKLRRTAEGETNFVPIVKGARATTDEAILSAYTGESVEEKREQGEDYWLDPELVQEEQTAEEKRVAVREEFKNLKDGFKEEKLRAEIVAPYKGKLIVGITVGIGVAAVIFAMFPSLLELSEPASIASFPDTL